MTDIPERRFLPADVIVPPNEREEAFHAAVAARDAAITEQANG
jgi:hypothetical protein